MAEKMNTAAKTAPATTESPAVKAAEPVVSAAVSATAKGVESVDARMRDVAAATSAGGAAKAQERSPATALRVVAKAPSIPRPVAKAPSAKRAAAKAPTTKRAVAKAPGAPRTSVGVAGYDELAAAGQENLEACVKCGTIVAKGMEKLSKEVFSFTQTAVEANLTAAQSILTAKTWFEAIDLQADFARDRFENMAAQTAKLGEISLQVANQALEPIQSRIGVSAEKLFQPFTR